MSESVQESPVGPPGPPALERRMRPGRALAATAGLLVVIGVAIAVTHPFGKSSPSARPMTDDAASTSLARVTQGTLSSQVNASGTLGYVAQADGSPYQVVNQAAGVFTALPTPGQVVGCGQVLYRVANNPVSLLCGNTPAYRSLFEGDSGPDVRQLNGNLVRLGYATPAELDPSSDYFSAETADALEQLQAQLGEDQTGSLNLGAAVFLPGPVRISSTTATLGTPANPGAPVAQATSIGRQVQVALDASLQSSVKVGDRALITLPDNQTTAGTVTRIGTVASASGSGAAAGGSSASSSGATIPLYIALEHTAAAAGLDQAPVQVQITTAGVNNALIVPVNALLAQSGGAYAVETVNARGVHHLVPVSLGLFDDADGLVQVTSNGLAAGDQVVIPST